MTGRFTGDPQGPAPVFAGDEPDLPPGLEAYVEPGAGVQSPGRWIVALVFVIAAALWLGSLSLSQATSRDAALPAISRGLVALTELDALMAVHVDDLEQAAAAGEPIAIEGFPVPAEIPAIEALDEGGSYAPQQLRDAVLAVASERIYAEGMGAFAREDGSTLDADPPPRLSTGGLVRSTFTWLTQSRHDSVSRFVVPLAFVTVLSGAAILWLWGGFSRFIRLGVLATVAAIPVLIAAFGARLVVIVIAEDDAVAQEFEQIARTLADIPLRNALLMGGAGLLVAIPAAILDAIFERSVRARFARPRTQ